MNDPHNASSQIGSLFPLPLEGRIPRLTVSGGDGPSSKEGSDIEDCRNAIAGFESESEDVVQLVFSLERWW